MPIIFRCKHCAQKLSVSSRKAGQVFDCPKCQTSIKVPRPQNPDAPRRGLPPNLAAPSSIIPRSQFEDDLRKEGLEQDDSFRPAEQTAAGQTAAEPAPPAESRKTSRTPAGRESQTRPTTAATPKSAAAATATSGAPPVQPPFAADAADDDSEGFQLRRTRTDTEEMDLTPMVDVTFLLLIFFMITASFSMTKTIETPPPDPEKQGARQTVQTLEDLEQTSVVVKIDDQDSVFVDDEPIADPSTLEDVLATKLVSENKNELVIQASENSRHETFVMVFDAGTGAGMQRIRVATQPAED